MKLILETNKKFQLSDQLNFAKMSGDFNPIHLDHNYARRSMSGDIVIHGINLVFWGLNIFLKLKRIKIKIKKINIIFSKFVNIDKKIKIKIFLKSKKIIFKILDSDILVSEFEIQYQKSNNEKYPFLNKKFIKIKPNVTNLRNFKLNKKFVEYSAINKNLLRKKYLFMYKYLNINQIIDFVTITRFVGMSVPGENSILSKIELNYIINKFNKSEIKISSIDQRFSLINLYYKGKNLSGNIRTLMRPKKITQDIQNKKLKIKKKEFANQRALIIGGSQGLGEAAVKILSLGSAKILFSYFKGKQDAVQNKEVLKKDVKIFNLNIEKKINSKTYKNIKNFKPTHLYYFATPKIFSGNGLEFNERNFVMFNKYYLTGFKKIFDLLDKKILQSIFFPSSVAINKATGKLCEYACSKAAQEILLKYLNEKYKKIYFSYPRLPRLKTDQTLSILNHKSQLPFKKLLTLFRKL